MKPKDTLIGYGTSTTEGSDVLIGNDPLQPFLQLDICITNQEGKSATVQARVLPSEIDYYYPGLYEGTVIVTKSRSSYITLMPVNEFDQVLKAYRDAVIANPGTFGVLKITPSSPKPVLHVAD